MRNFTTLILIILICFNGFSQNNKTFFHLYEPSASESKLISWNVKDTLNQRYLIKEVIDDKNRVQSIQFLVNGKTEDYNPMYGVDNIVFEYDKNTITETYLDKNNNPLSFLKHEIPTSIKYVLNDKNEIIDCITIYNIQFTELTKSKLLEIENLLRYWRESVLDESDTFLNQNKCGCNMNFVYGYLYSYAKLNTVFPKKENYKFNFDKYNMIFSEDIIKELKNKYEP